VYTLKTLLW